jgi:hypothetical protein
VLRPRRVTGLPVPTASMCNVSRVMRSEVVEAAGRGDAPLLLERLMSPGPGPTPAEDTRGTEGRMPDTGTPPDDMRGAERVVTMLRRPGTPA